VDGKSNERTTVRRVPNRRTSGLELHDVRPDPTIKQWVVETVDNLGGYGIEASPGWQGTTISWAGKGLDGSTFTDVFTKVSNTETSDDSTTTDPQGKVSKVTIHCTKAGS
jgi:hypothetical protein